MSDKKHIDRIFQEKLKDFEATPSPEVWKNIQGKLEQPKKDTKKVFPIWLRIAGVAALLLVLLTVGNLMNSNFNNTTETNVVDIENEVNNTSEKENVNTSNLDNSNNIIAEESSNASIEEKTSIEDLIVSEENKTFTNVSENKNNVTTNNQNPVVNSQDNSSIYSNTERVTANNMHYRNQDNNAVSGDINNEETNATNSNKNQDRLAQNNSENRNRNIGNITELDKNKVDSELKKNTTNTVTDISTNKEEENTTIDAETKTEEKSIEEEIAKAEDLIEKEEEKVVNRWQVYANAAPVYYNTLGKGSHIDEQFNENSKSGETNMSYGVNVSYAFNEKLKLRTGVNTLKLSYDTDDVILYENVSSGNSATLKNINFNNQAVSAISADNLGVQQAVGILPNENAAISQRLGYYEIPLELEYTVSNKKLGVNVIAGMSTFVLNDNKIYSEFEGRNTEIGEANNINNVSFSGNLGLGLDYKFSDKIKVNVQPTFKYQMNAYKNTSGDFRPYIVGVYTGLSYKF